MKKKIIAIILICILTINFNNINIGAAEVVYNLNFDVTKCVLFSQNSADSITINAGNLSINGDIISGGEYSFTSQTENINGNAYQNQEINMLKLLPSIEKSYMFDYDYYNEDYVSENYNENIYKSKYIAGTFECNNFLSANNSAVVVGGDINIKNQVSNMNNTLLVSIVGDINIESNNFSLDGIVYAPLGKVNIYGDNINLNGMIIAQEIIINGRYNVNLNKKESYINNLLTEEIVSAVKYGEEDADEIDIGEIYIKNSFSENDVIYVGEGLYCIKNQFLLSVKEDISFSIIDELVKKYDAVIVGYIELTNDYQIEINHNVDVNELLSIIDEFSSIDYIISADLNLVSEQEKCFRSNDSQWNGVWDEDIRKGHEISAETIKLKSALIKAGVIENESASYRDVDTSMLYDIKVGIIDSGFDTWNPNSDLVFTEVWNNYDNLDALKHIGDTNPQVDFHGTECAAAMAAEFNNGIGISGICIKNRLYAFSTHNPGAISKTLNSIINDKYAFALMIGNNIRVISRSLGCPSNIVFAAYLGNYNAKKYLKKYADQMTEYLKKFTQKGYDFIIVNSAGNENDQMFYKVKEEADTPYGFVNVNDYNKSDYPSADTTKTYGSKYSKADIVSPDGGFTFYNIDARYGNEYAYITDPEIQKRIIIVGAMNSTDLDISGNYEGWMCNYSNRGNRVDICALGEDVWTLTVKGEGLYGLDYRNGRGTSIATPQVAGALGLAYSVNPAMTADELISYLKNNYTDYTNHMINEIEPSLDKFRIKYVNAEKLVLGAIESSKAYSSPHIMNNVSEGLIIGSVYDSSNTPIRDVNISVQKISEYGISTVTDLDKKITLTDIDGMYTISVPAGEYEVLFQKDGYRSEMAYVSIEAESSFYLERMYLEKIKSHETMDAMLKGYVVDAITGNPIEGASIKYKKGWNNRYGSNIGFFSDKTSYTNSDGTYYEELPKGAYTVEVTKEGYYTAYSNILVGSYEAYTVLTPIANDNEYRVVLTWGEIPSDLDSHLTGVLEEKIIHIYYSSKEVYSNGIVIASLDYDDTSSYGPETITFTINSNNDSIKYYVYDYTNGGNSSSYDLSYSNAKVTVYSGNNLNKPKVYNVPVGKTGTIWNVFEIKNNILSDINIIE